ncbi:MAG: GxxExxY protein [Anaerolineales bacterium]|nr:GxxExxY protein [Anaerolineales bacterium]
MKPENFRASAAGRVIRSPHGYWAFAPAPLPPALNWSDALVSSLSQAERNLSRLSSLGESLPSPHLLARPFVRREAVVSSRIEGTRASLADLYTYETAQLSFLEAGSDVQEVHNYVRALDYGLERLKSLPVSLRLIREVHARLMEGVRGERLAPGEFRRSQNWIGPPRCTLEDAPYVPPPVDEMHAALDRLEKFIHAPSDLPPLARASMAHYQVEDKIALELKRREALLPIDQGQLLAYLKISGLKLGILVNFGDENAWSSSVFQLITHRTASREIGLQIKTLRVFKNP